MPDIVDLDKPSSRLHLASKIMLGLSAIPIAPAAYFALEDLNSTASLRGLLAMLAGVFIGFCLAIMAFLLISLKRKTRNAQMIWFVLASMGFALLALGALNFGAAMVLG